MNEEEKFLYANHKAEEVFGVAPGKLVGRSLFDFLAPQEKEKIEQETVRRKKGQEGRYELEILREGGEKRTLWVSASPILGSDGNYLGAIGLFEDITYRKTQEQEIERLAAIVNEAHEVFLLLNQKGDIVKWNKRAEELFPLLGQKQASINYKDLFTASSREEAIKHFEAVLQEGKSYRFEGKLKTGERETIFAWITIFPTRLKGSQVEEIAVLIVDISERKKAEELHEEFVRSLIHDISNPITAAQTALEMAFTESSDSPSFSEHMNITSQNLTRISNLMHKFSQSLNRSYRKINLEKRPLVLSELLSRILESQKPLFLKKGVKLEFEIEKNGFQILANENLERSVVNILDNALKFTPTGGTVKVILKQEGERALIEISDTGIGISREDLPHIFERFFKGKSAFSGTGLGLYTAKLTIEEHGGEITVESEEGKGSKFTISLPILREPPD